MGRSFSFVSILLVAGLPVACSFNKATEDEIRMDAAIHVDVQLPPNGDGNNTFESDGNVTCVATNPMVTNVPPDILILLDRSGSMNEDLTGMSCGNAGCGATSKWTITTAALANYLPTVEATVNLGLKLFASSTSGDGCMVSNTAEIAPVANNAAAINARLMANSSRPGSSTPTTAALMNAGSYLSTLKDPNPKFILLVTDGIPTCGKSMCAAGVNAGTNTNQCDDANAIAMVKTVHDMGFPTFVLGVGTSSSPGDGTLSQMAMNGGYPRNDTPAYYPIDKPEDLTAAFMAVTGMVSKCFFSLSPPLNNSQRIDGVTADGNNLAPGDYMIVGNNGVQLVGQKCDDFTNGTIKEIKLQVSCNG